MFKTNVEQHSEPDTPKVVRPLRDAMCLIDTDETDWRHFVHGIAPPINERRLTKTLRRNKEYLYTPAAHRFQDLLLLRQLETA